MKYKEGMTNARPIPNYPDYLLSDDGQVISARKSPMKPLKVYKDGRVSLCKDGIAKRVKVSDLLTEVWGL